MPDTEANLDKWIELNAKYSADWPNVTVKGETPKDADDWKGVPDKFEKHFSSEPGSGG